MYLNTKNFIELNQNSLVKFLGAKIKEDLYLDYKVDLSSSEKRKAHKEFLKDVTAFANANGGNILIGVCEPSEDLTIDKQLLGIANANEYSQDLERLTVSNIDPRISGLRIKVVPLSNNKSVIAIHIPPSLNRPHMVNYDSHRTFYMRHSESSFPMTTHEIRNSVMESLSAEEKAKNYLNEKEADIRDYFLDNTRSFIRQAMPLISLESSWDIFDKKIEKIMLGDSRRYNYLYDLASNMMPRPTIDGLLGRDQRDNPNWQTEIHRNGYVSLVYKNQFPSLLENSKTFIIHSGFEKLFDSFLGMVEELLTVTNTDVPYIISCKYIGANKTHLFSDNLLGNYSEVYGKEDIIFPFHYRQVGEPMNSIAGQLCLELFNAYGFKNIL